MSTQKIIDRRSFCKKSLKAGAISSLALTGFSTIVPASVFGKNAPSNKINLGAIGMGRIFREYDTAQTIKYDKARIRAVCDIDSK